MTKLRVKRLAAPGSPETLIASAQGRIEKLVAPENHVFVENEPDVLFFLTGGTERKALDLVLQGRFYLLIGSQYNNSYASATEVKAYLNEKNISSLLLDEEETMTKAILDDFVTVKAALNNLKGKKAWFNRRNLRLAYFIRSFSRGASQEIWN
jgi:hypothetical protein